MKNVNLNLPPVGGKKLQLKVKTTINYDDLKKKRVTEKHSNHDQFFCGLEEYVLLYADEKKHSFCVESLPLDFNLAATRKN